jgi:hypothetical protein
LERLVGKVVELGHQPGGCAVTGLSGELYLGVEPLANLDPPLAGEPPDHDASSNCWMRASSARTNSLDG